MVNPNFANKDQSLNVFSCHGIWQLKNKICGDEYFKMHAKKIHYRRYKKFSQLTKCDFQQLA